MDNTTFDYACALDFRMRATRYRKLAVLYPPDVTAMLMSMANDLEAAADEIEDGNSGSNRLRPPYFPDALAS